MADEVEELKRELEGAENEATLQRDRAKRAERQTQAIVVALANETERADRNHVRWTEVWQSHADERARRQKMQAVARVALSAVLRGMLSSIETIQAFQAIVDDGGEPAPDSRIAKAVVTAYDRIWHIHEVLPDSPGGRQAGHDASVLTDALIAEGLTIETLRAIAGEA